MTPQSTDLQTGPAPVTLGSEEMQFLRTFLVWPWTLWLILTGVLALVGLACTLYGLFAGSLGFSLAGLMALSIGVLAFGLSLSRAALGPTRARGALLLTQRGGLAAPDPERMQALAQVLARLPAAGEAAFQERYGDLFAGHRPSPQDSHLDAQASNRIKERTNDV